MLNNLYFKIISFCSLDQNNFILEPYKNIVFIIVILIGTSDFFCFLHTGGNH